MGPENSWFNVHTTWVWKISGLMYVLHGSGKYLVFLTYYVGLENSWFNVCNMWVWKIAGLMYVPRGSGK